MQKHRFWILLTLLAVVALTVAACGGAATPAPAEPAATEAPAPEPAATEPPAPEPEPEMMKAIVGTNAEYPPFESVDDAGNIVGFDIDIMNAIAEATGLEVEFVNTRWDGIFVALASGEFDAVISAATITDERKETVDFSDPYFNAGQMLAVPAGSDIASPDDLAGKRVGVQLGTTGDIWSSENTDAEVVRYDEITLAFQALAQGDIDAIINDGPTSADIIKANPEMGVTLVGEPFTEEFYGIAVNKEKPELLAALNEGLAAIKASGQYDEIYDKWFGVPEVAEAPAEGEGDLLVVEAPCANNKVQKIEALDELTVQVTMCKPDPAFLAKIAFTPFFIQPKEWIEETGGGGELLEHPIGTGPYMLDSWNRGDSIAFKRFDDYWGEPAKTETLIFRWSTEGAARLLELQSGTADYIVKLSPDDYETVENDPNLQFLPVPNPNIMYLAMTNTFEPWGDVNVRKAIAMGIDRERVVDFFYPEGSEAASHFTPCSIPNGCNGEAWYDFDPDAANALLDEAGYPKGDDGIRFKTSIFYRDVFRVYLPEPSLVAVELQTQLRDNLGIDAEVVVMESGQFIAESTAGNLDGLYMLGWGADYLHVTNFLDFHFSRSNPQFGDPFPEIYEVLEEASTIADPETAAPLYEKANNAIRDLVPMVPMAHGAPADAALGDVQNAKAAVLGPPDLWTFVPGDRDQLIYLKAAEPISLYCTDETDGESLDACKMVTEGLFKYNAAGESVPTLATGCEANDDATVWTCHLREGVKFHDGSTLDANDVVRSWEAGLNAASPYHVGNTGAFEYPSYLFDALMNAE
ncbi:MAG TPA: transporter substrate-binding domain-containing protein [Caldilineae bacterium]|nr:transporter substrate-binding domain-containing protein [Caldilineae bacterium]